MSRTHPLLAALRLGAGTPWLPGANRRLAVAASTARLWLHRSRTRRALADLDQHLLDDIGRGRLDAQRESAKPFWR